MKVGIIGLGLIGGSMAKAYKKANVQVLGMDIDEIVLQEALNCEAIDEILTAEKLKQCQLILIALYPAATIEYLKTNAENFSKDCIIIDLCGVKQKVCQEAFAIAEKHNLKFIGGHPMAGVHKIGFAHSRANMFVASSMILVPKKDEENCLIEQAKNLLAPAGFGRFTVTTAEEHDRMIAFTSQLAHVVSNAYIKSPAAANHQGFSAGSYRDLTRVAWLNEKMWSQLFLANKEALLEELDWLIEELGNYREMLAQENSAGLEKLLRDGRLAKERVDGFDNSKN